MWVLLQQIPTNSIWYVTLKKTCWWAFSCEFRGMVLRERWIRALKCSALLLAAARQQSVSSNFVALELFETQRLQTKSSAVEVLMFPI
jgi:hypothetical protein